MAQWAEFPISGRMFDSGDETLLSRAIATLENVYPNDAGGHSRFPGIDLFVAIPGDRVYLQTFRNELYAGTDRGRLWRITQAGIAQDVTGVPISGGLRWIFTASDDALLMAAGGPIIHLGGNLTHVLSTTAPNTTHPCSTDGYILANEPNSARFFHSDPGVPTNWDPQSVFTAEAKPENIVAMVITPYNELMVVCPTHIEQWERLANGDQPFNRRWITGQGCAFPYTLVADTTGTYGVNDSFEFVRFAGQVSQPQSDDVAQRLEEVDDWTEAWAQELAVGGGRYIVLSIPHATNPYGSKGITLALDYRAKKFLYLYGPRRHGLPTGYPAWSFARCYNQTFVGVPGGVGIYRNNGYEVLGEEQPTLIRTPHVSKFGTSRIDNFSLRLRRGTAVPSARAATQRGTIRIRVNRDNRGFGPWQEKIIGAEGSNEMVIRFGGQGCANTWQFEISASDAVPLEIVEAKAQVERLSW